MNNVFLENNDRNNEFQVKYYTIKYIKNVIRLHYRVYYFNILFIFRTESKWKLQNNLKKPMLNK